MKILIVQTSYLGDTILSTPVITELKNRYPEAQLWMMTTPLSSQLVERDPLLAGVIQFDKRGQDSGWAGLTRMKNKIQAKHFDRVYSLHRSMRTSVLLWLCHIPLRIGFKTAQFNFLYHQLRKRNPEDHDVIRNLAIVSEEAHAHFSKAELRLFAPGKEGLRNTVKKEIPLPQKYVTLVPGSAWKTKMWHWEGYRDVARFFKKNGFTVILLGAESDREVNARVADGLDIIDLAGKTSVADAMYVVKYSRLVICNDSMTLHLASAFKVPNVAIFCATAPEFGFSPWRNHAIVVEKKGLSCKPCRRHGSKRCPTGTEACMKELLAEDVIQAAKTLLAVK